MPELTYQFQSVLGYQALFDELAEEERLAEWVPTLQENIQNAFQDPSNGNLQRWLDGFEDLPELIADSVDFATDAVTANGKVSNDRIDALRGGLMQLHPWRKGPFELFGLPIDTEWRSDWKWRRVAPHVDLRGKNVLDVGCGNGYYGWRMLGAGARRVIGLDPMTMYVVQAAAIRKYLGALPNYVIPGSDLAIGKGLNGFDTVFSMGVLYHRSSPIEHLQSLASALRQDGQLVLETLVIHGDQNQVFVPSGRYAQMRNVWFIPSPAALTVWLCRCGFHDIQTVDVTPTTVEEQRATEWMNFDSLVDFLDPNDHAKTIEGYHAPIRAILTARKK